MQKHFSPNATSDSEQLANQNITDSKYSSWTVNAFCKNLFLITILNLSQGT